MQQPNILLASSSPYRQRLLEKLGMPFITASPNIDETPLTNESVPQMVMRLSLLKAHALRARYPEHYIIASDQAACLDEQPLGKPGHYEAALAQLHTQQGKTVTFYTGLALLPPTSVKALTRLDTTKVIFRHLTKEQLHQYLITEQPYNCAGSFKSEGMGIILFEAIESRDPNALIGLPLIDLVSLFMEAGVTLPLTPTH